MCFREGKDGRQSGEGEGQCVEEGEERGDTDGMMMFLCEGKLVCVGGGWKLRGASNRNARFE